MKGCVQLHSNEVLAVPLGRVFAQQPQRSTAATIHPPAPAVDDPFADIDDGADSSPIYVLGEGDNPDPQHQCLGHRQKREQ